MNIYLYKHAMLSSLFSSGFQVFLKSLLLGRNTLQLGGVVRHQLVARFSQLTLFTIQRLKSERVECSER